MSSVVVVGATSGVGRALATQLAQSGSRLILVARDEADLQATAADLRLRWRVECKTVAQDIADPAWDVTAFAKECEAFGAVDQVLIPAGGNAAWDVGPNPDAVALMMNVNYTGPARIAAAFGSLMATRGSGSVVLFSSIAAGAPRTRNAAYSAAKAALETYGKALRHHLEPKGVRVLVIALGYVDTALSFGMSLKFPVAQPAEVADYVLRRAKLAAGKRYFPGFWWVITMILRHLPWLMYRRLSF